MFNNDKPDTVHKAKVALVQFIIGLIMTVVAVAFKSIILFLISIIIFAMGIKGFFDILIGKFDDGK